MSNVDQTAVSQPAIEQATLQSVSKSDLGVRIAFAETPKPGEPVQVAERIWWIRLPLTSAMDHVNVYALEDRHAWTLVDTGSNTPA
ncbi:MAG: hypothetical protein SFV81_16115, partial [Pirellulaceae bacterium]|nr:hypothetical protein [Pirellulaceae bacterium]